MAHAAAASAICAQGAVAGALDGDGGRGRTLVFARDVAAANEAADFLFEVCVLPAPSAIAAPACSASGGLGFRA